MRRCGPIGRAEQQAAHRREHPPILKKQFQVQVRAVPANTDEVSSTAEICVEIARVTLLRLCASGTGDIRAARAAQCRRHQKTQSRGPEEHDAGKKPGEHKDNGGIHCNSNCEEDENRPADRAAAQ
ncbi:MAG: hypothetical protein H0W33_04150 [Gammaproteobacteria bacterium]|nr:hypothetical protein [Gammaproteobacteria bacterium]